MTSGQLHSRGITSGPFSSLPSTPTIPPVEEREVKLEDGNLEVQRERTLKISGLLCLLWAKAEGIPLSCLKCV